MVEDKNTDKSVVTIKFSDPYALALIAILLLALILRIYFLYHTLDQTLWWDEAEYMSAAKKWAFGVPYEYNVQRPPLFQFMSSLLFRAGLGELAIRFLLVILPSVLLVYCVYLLGKEMYSREAGVIAAFLTATSWTFLFWANRVQPDYLSMTAQVIAIYFMWKHWKQNNLKNVLLAGFFAALGFYFKVSALLVPMIFIVFLLVTDRLSAFKNKYYYYFSISFLLTLVPYFIWAFIAFRNPIAFKSNYVDAVHDFPIGWYNFNFYYSLTEGLTFILFLIGAIIAFRGLLYLDLLVKDKKKCFDPDIFSLISLLFISAFYIFYMRNTDDRWVFLWMPFIFLLVARTCMVVYKKISTKSTIAALVVVLILIGICGYYQIDHASSIINAKKDSYAPVKAATLWIKDNSNRSDKVYSVSYTQTVYYTEANVTTYSMIPQLPNSTEFDKMVLNDRPRYIIWSVFERHPDWTAEWVNSHIAKADINLAYSVFSDAQQKQPALLVFSPDYSKYS